MLGMSDVRKVRALWDSATIRVYQAFSCQIADPALTAQTFVEPFGRRRMTWIKPSFLWMMYRSGWGLKDDAQRRILAIDITHEGFLWALQNASLSAGPKLNRSCPVRVQWDPDRDIHLRRMSRRTIQVGLSGEAVSRYADEWIVSIHDVTSLAHRLRDSKDPSLLPEERDYPVPAGIADRLDMAE